MTKQTEIWLNRRLAIWAAASLTALAAPQAQAGLTDVSLFRTGEYDQTGPSTVVPADGGTNYFFAGVADVNSDTDYDVNGVTLTVPTSPTTQYTMAGPTGSAPFINYLTQSSLLTKTALDSAYPSGDYVFTATNSGTGDSATVTVPYDGTDFYSTPPQYTASTYNGLAGMNASAPYTFTFDPFTPAAGDTGLVFFTIFQGSNVVYSNSGPDTTTDFVLPAGTLTPGVSYVVDLDFSTRDEILDPSCVEVGLNQCPGRAELAWDVRTDVSFTTGSGTVPEPSTWAMMLLGFAGLGFAGWRASRTTAESGSRGGGDVIRPAAARLG